MEDAFTETVLVVEDNDSVRQFVCLVLRSNGYLVLEAADGKTALGLSCQHEGTIRLLMVDIGLPDIRGPELAVSLQADRIGIKVLFLTGNDESELNWYIERFGQAQLLQKPFTMQALLDTVRQALESQGNPR